MPNPYGWGDNEPQIKPKDQGGDTVATFSQKVYNLFNNLFDTLNSYPWSPATQNDAGYMSAADKTALDNVPTRYFPLAGGTITGQTGVVTDINKAGMFQLANPTITKGTAPSQATYLSLGFFGDDQTDYTRRLSVLETVYNPDRSVSIRLGAYKSNTATDTAICTISCNIDAAGNIWTCAPTPSTADVSTKIATTAYVDAHASNVQAKILSPTSAVTTPHFSSCAVQNHVCFVELSFDLAATPAFWTAIKIFDLPVTPTVQVAGLLNNQDGSVGGIFIEARTDGGLYMRFTGGTLPTNTYYHGGIVFPC